MTEEKPTAAFILSLVAGAFILLGGGMTMIGSWMGNYGMMSRYASWGGMMGTGYGMMGFAFGALGILGLVFGTIVIISALMITHNSTRRGVRLSCFSRCSASSAVRWAVLA